MKRLIILGSTGSIGTQTLQIVEKFPHLFSVEALTADSSWELLAKQARKFKAKAVALRNEKYIHLLEPMLEGSGIKILKGEKGIDEIAAMDCDMVITALVGISGLSPTLKAIDAGRTIALANKETLVVGGELVITKAKEKNVNILPIDSEHSAIFQCLKGEDIKDVDKIVLTSSGGPFRNLSIDQLKTRTAADALKHPTWNMGNKVTIDSSTLMNKGFEVIEARWLFDISPDKIEVIIHPQSIIHSMVRFIDGSIIAQLSTPDMRIPIQYALSYPDRLPAEYVITDFTKIGSFTFEEPRWNAFPCLEYAFDSLKIGGTMPAVLNGANEVAVQLFLDGRIGYTDIALIIHQAMNSHKIIKNPYLEDLLEADREARETANKCLQ